MRVITVENEDWLCAVRNHLNVVQSSGVLLAVAFNHDDRGTASLGGVKLMSSFIID